MRAQDQADLGALTSMIRLLLRGRPTAVKLEHLPALHERFQHLPPFNRATLTSQTPQSLRTQLGQHLESWLPADEAALQSASLPADPAGRDLLRRTLTRADSKLENNRKRLAKDWDNDQTNVTWTAKTARGYLHDTASTIAAAILDQHAATKEVQDAPPAQAENTVTVLAMNTVRLEGHTTVYRSYLRRVEVLTGSPIVSPMRRRGE